LPFQLGIEIKIEMKKSICILICFLLTVNMSVAQSHEFSIYGTGGMSSLHYKFDAGKVSGGFGGGGGVGYTYNISPKFGITTGVEFTLYGSKVTSDAFSGQYNTPDDNGDDFRFTYSVSGYEEKQSATLLTIPVMAQYSIKSKSISVVLAGGLKLGLPMSATTTISPGSITTSGTYVYEDQIYTDLSQHGFVTGQSVSAVKSDISLGFFYNFVLGSGTAFFTERKSGIIHRTVLRLRIEQYPEIRRQTGRRISTIRPVAVQV
jgi:hypothetical protein